MPHQACGWRDGASSFPVVVCTWKRWENSLEIPCCPGGWGPCSGGARTVWGCTHRLQLPPTVSLSLSCLFSRFAKPYSSGRMPLLFSLLSNPTLSPWPRFLWGFLLGFSRAYFRNPEKWTLFLSLFHSCDDLNCAWDDMSNCVWLEQGSLGKRLEQKIEFLRKTETCNFLQWILSVTPFAGQSVLLPAPHCPSVVLFATAPSHHPHSLMFTPLSFGKHHRLSPPSYLTQLKLGY